MGMRLNGDRTTRSDWRPGELEAASPHRFAGDLAVGFDPEVPDALGETLGACVLFARSRQVLDSLALAGVALPTPVEAALEGMAEQLDAMARRWPIAFAEGDDLTNPAGLPARWGLPRAEAVAR